MGSRAGVANLRTIEFIRAYDRMLERYPDPLEVCFRLLKSRKQTIQIQAATQLLQYRYPKLAAVKVESEQPAQLSMSWDDGGGTVIDAKPADDVIAEIEALSNEQRQ